METPTPFDLTRAIAIWRGQLAQSPAFREENLDELESHLRDSIEFLQSRGLSGEEAFVVATGRIGKRSVLEPEFGKFNAAEISRRRAFWMVAGILTFVALSDLAKLLSVLAAVAGRFAIEDGKLLGWAGVAVWCAVFALGFRFFQRISNGGFKPHIARKWLLQNPRLAMTAVVCVTCGLNFGATAAPMFASQQLGLNTLGRFYFIVNSFQAIAFILLVGLLAAAWIRLLRPAPRPAAPAR